MRPRPTGGRRANVPLPGRGVCSAGSILHCSLRPESHSLRGRKQAELKDQFPFPRLPEAVIPDVADPLRPDDYPDAQHAVDALTRPPPDTFSAVSA